MKKISLNMDAFFTIFLAFLLSVSFNFHQRYQYSDLLLEYTSLRLDRLSLEYSVSFNRAALNECRFSKSAVE